ncbi:MAG: hypothetical protein AAGB31_11070 [Bdellovibrio sp.]
MTFSRKILLIFILISTLFTAFSVMSLIVFEQVKSENDELIEDKIYIFSKAQSIANMAKSVEAAGVD